MPVSQPKGPSIQEQPGFGQFNQARFLALQAGPLAVTPSDHADERSPHLEGLAHPAYQVTAANAEPVAPRGKNRNDALGGINPTRQAVNQLLDEIEMSQPVFAGQKRRASDGDLQASAAAKKQLIAVAPYPSANAIHPVVTGSQAVPGVPYMAPVFQTQSAINHTAAMRWGVPTCTHCFQHQVPNCDGQAHCNQGGSHKCYYVLCDPATCLGAACVKIHSSQYDLQARKSGQVRRLVIGDPDSVSADQWDKRGHGKAVAAMDRAILPNMPLLAGLPALNQGIYQVPQGHVQGSGSGSKGRHPFKALKASRQPASTSNPALKPESARSGPLFDARGIKVESSSDG